MSFIVGQIVRHRSAGELGRVVSAPSEAGYCEIKFINSLEMVPIADLEPVEEREADPLARLVAGKFGVSEEHDLYVRAAVLDHAFQYDERSGLSNSRIEPKLHQIFVMLRVLNKSQARMILADEVGLGKTIEAGLVIKELRARKLADRVLIVCPASLVEQWRHELASKFNESFEIFNATALDYLGRGRRDPWSEHDSIICSLPFAIRHAEEILDAASWDLVIFDEAHKVSRRQNGGAWESKKSFDFANALTEETRGLLLLTATPMQVHQSQLYSLVDLVEPGLFGSFKQFDRYVRELPNLNELMKAVQNCAACGDADRRTLLTPHARMLDRLGFDVEDVVSRTSDVIKRERMLTDLASQHPLADVLVRNRKREVLEGFQPRVPKVYPVEPSITEMALYEEVTEYIRAHYDTAIKTKHRATGFLMVAFQKMLTSSSAAICASFEKRIAKLESWLSTDESRSRASGRATEETVDEWREAGEVSLVVDDLLDVEVTTPDGQAKRSDVEAEIVELSGFVERLRRIKDAKATVLVGALRELFTRDPEEKVLIFTQFIETQMFLVDELAREGFAVEYFNGSMKLNEKESAVKRFRESSQVLVSTEAGGEGRNFQFCHIMVNYDLPWNPMRVEQRIGRIDRIGQKRPVEIYNLAIYGTLEERVLKVLESRIKLFEESVGSLDPILGDIEKEFEQLAMSGEIDSPEALAAFEENVERRRREALAREEVQQDLAMDRNSFRRDEANRWLKQTPMAEWTDLRDFLSEALTYFGGRMSKDAEGHTVIAISPALKADIKLKKSRYEGEFDPTLALVDEPGDFFAMGHEVVQGLVELAKQNDSSICGAVIEPAFSEPVIEVIYQLWSRKGKPRGRLIRHRVGKELVVDSEIVETFPKKRQSARSPMLPKWVAAATVESKDYIQRVDLACFGEESAQALEVYRKHEQSRITRIHEHVLERMTGERARLEAQIAELEERGTEKQKKILPARKGTLNKLLIRIEEKQAEYERAMNELAMLSSDHRARVLAVTLVVPA